MYLLEKQSNFVSYLTKNREFTNDIISFFSRKKEGHIGKWLYFDSKYENDPACGSSLWREWAQDRPNYYMIKGQKEIIEKYAGSIAKITGKCEQIIDLGPGEKTALQTSTFPFLKAYEDFLNKYISVDICPTYALEAINEVKNTFPHLKCQKIICDFRNDNFNRNYFKDSVCLYMGGTIGNFIAPEKTKNTIPYLARELENLKNNFIYGTYLIIGLDANQESQTIYESYDSSKHAAYGTNFLYRIQRDIIPNQKNFNPKAWAYRMMWHAESFQFCHIVECLEDQLFQIGSHIFNIKKGEKFLTENSFKIPTGIFQQAAIQAGYEPLASYLDDDKRMALHVLRVVA